MFILTQIENKLICLPKMMTFIILQITLIPAPRTLEKSIHINKIEVSVCDFEINKFFKTHMIILMLLKPKHAFFKIFVCLSVCLFVRANLRNG